MAAQLQARGVKLVSGGTDNHLLLVDLTDEECTGKDLEARLDSVHITANKNTVPGEKRSPFITSGVRLGTPAATTRGMGVEEMKVIADCIADCIYHYDEKKDEISARVLALTEKFPLCESSPAAAELLHPDFRAMAAGSSGARKSDDTHTKTERFTAVKRSVFISG